MIRSFKHKGLKNFFVTGSVKGIPTVYTSRIQRMLDRLDVAQTPNDMDIVGYGFHRLKGSRKDEYAVWKSANWRLVFAFQAHDAIDVNLEDYH